MKTKPAITESAIKMTTAILVSVLAAGLASAQSPSIIQNTRNTMNAVSHNATAASNQTLGIQQPPAAESIGVASARSSSSSSPSHPGRAKTKGAKRTPAVAATHSVPSKTAASHPPAAVLAGNSPAGSAEGDKESEQSVAPDSKYNANGRRDPFISPVVSHSGGSNCSTGKKCLEIGTISLRGVVHSDNGFIAVVSNGLNKAYFLRENDPVFNGYVMKITGDSIVFQETLQDRLGKSFTREVVKKITAPAV